MTRLKQVSAILTAKGGCSKTTTTLYLAESLLQVNKDYRILIIDLDGQGNASKLLGWKRKSYEKTIWNALTEQSAVPVYSTNTNGVFLSPAHPFLSSIEVALQRFMQPKATLRKCFSKPIENLSGVEMPDDIAEAFDFIFVDCPPAITDLSFNAMSVSDSLVIPTQTESLSIDALSKTISAFQEFKEDMKPDLRICGILLTMVDDRTSAAKQLSSYIYKQYSNLVFHSKIRRCTKIVETQALCKPLFEYAPHCSSAIDYKDFADEYLTRIY